LNEPLVFHFSDELDPASVTPSSARVLDIAGRLVAGRFHVEGNRLVFEPRLPRQPDLQDGGFRPSSEVRVELSGFPVPSGLRSRGGQVLEASFSSSFEVVSARGEGASFLDGTPDAAYPLFLASTTVGPLEPIRLSCVEPIDPRSLHPAAFQLRRYRAGGAFEELAVEVKLVSNSMVEGARLELRALEQPDGGVPRMLAPGDYHLWIHPGEDGPQDLGGHPVRSSWASTQLPARVSVEPRPELAGNRWHRVDFLDGGLSSPAAVPGTDGTAPWGTRGELRLQLPLAAGDGSAGRVLLDSESLTALRAARQDLHAAALDLPAGITLDVGALRGPVVMRSQTSMRLDGRLERLSGEAAGARLAGETWPVWYGRVGGARAAGQPAGVLAAWIEARRGTEDNLTVLVAGGDLVVEGELVVDGVLLLAAGGRLRIAGRVEAREVWVVGLGGGADVHPAARPSRLRFASDGERHLAAPLKVGALSAPYRPEGPTPRWRSALVGAVPGSGRVRVRYLGERDQPGGRIETVGPGDDAALLDRCEAIRMWIELEIAPGVPWDPPMVDFVELRWTEETDL
jgi:hypothetical protein